MVFPRDIGQEHTPILRFSVEAWDWDGIWGDYWHYEFSVGSGHDYGWNTGCFLYPQETGVFRVNVGSCADYPENCISEHAFSEKPPEATGMRLMGYQDLKTYIPWPDLYPDYHLQVENPYFSVIDQRIAFGFELPKSFFNPNYEYLTWVIVYDENGKMLGILSKSNSEELFIDNGGDTYHISGYHAPELDPGTFVKDYFQGDLLDEDYDRIDHIRVMVEKEHKSLCHDNWYDDYRNYMATHPV
jgi:hypothetical protein